MTRLLREVESVQQQEHDFFFLKDQESGFTLYVFEGVFVVRRVFIFKLISGF